MKKTRQKKGMEKTHTHKQDNEKRDGEKHRGVGGGGWDEESRHTWCETCGVKGKRGEDVHTVDVL